GVIGRVGAFSPENHKGNRRARKQHKSHSEEAIVPATIGSKQNGQEYRDERGAGKAQLQEFGRVGGEDQINQHRERGNEQHDEKAGDFEIVDRDFTIVLLESLAEMLRLRLHSSAMFRLAHLQKEIHGGGLADY